MDDQKVVKFLKGKKWIKIVKSVYCRFQDDDVPALGAQLTYFLILSFFPFLIFLITLVSYTPVTGEAAMRDLSRLLPAGIYSIIADILRQILAVRSGTLLSFGMIAALWTASDGVGAVIKGINKAYDQEESRSFWKIKIISILFTLTLALVLIFSFILLIFGEMLGTYLFHLLGRPETFGAAWDIVRYIITLLTLLLVFTSLYYHIPNRRMSIKDVLPGAIFSTIGWAVISVAFSFYMNSFGNFSYTYGSIGGIIGLLIWLYWSSLILLTGGELNATLHYARQGKERPKGKRYC